jgi:hypothetical protein
MTSGTFFVVGSRGEPTQTLGVLWETLAQTLGTQWENPRAQDAQQQN